MQCSMNPTVRPRHQQQNCTERIKLCIDFPSSENTNCASPSSVDLRGAEQHSSEVSASDEENSKKEKEAEQEMHCRCRKFSVEASLVFKCKVAVNGGK